MYFTSYYNIVHTNDPKIFHKIFNSITNHPLRSLSLIQNFPLRWKRGMRYRNRESIIEYHGGGLLQKWKEGSIEDLWCSSLVQWQINKGPFFRAKSKIAQKWEANKCFVLELLAKNKGWVDSKLTAEMLIDFLPHGA